jgi:hypothetical protein
VIALESEDAWLKTERAKQHICDLKIKKLASLGTDPYKVLHQFDSQAPME